MNEQMIKKIVQDEIAKDKQSSQYNINKTSKHIHNGIDSLQVPFTNLGGVSSYLVMAKVTLTPTQIKALHTTPITLVPAPIQSTGISSPNVITIVVGITAYLSFNMNAYTGSNNLEFRYTNASGAKVTTDMSSTFLDSSSSAYDYAPAVSTELTPVANAPIVVSVPVANPAAGDSYVTFVVHYRQITF